MQLLLEENGSMASKCSTAEIPQDGTSVVCPAQTAALINIQFIASTTQVVAPLLGQIADHYGAPTVAYLMAFGILLGLTLLVLATEYLIDPLLYVAFILLALGTWLGGLLTIQTGLYFTGRTQHRIIVALNSLFDSAAVTYLGLWAIREWTGASVSIVLLGYLGLGVLVLGGGSYFWAVAVPDGSNRADDSTAAAAAADVVVTEHVLPSEEGEEEPSEVLQATTTDTNVPHQDDSSDRATETPSPLLLPDLGGGVAMETETAASTKAAASNYVLIRDRTPFQQLTSMPAAMLALFFAIQVTSNQWTLTTTRDFLAYLGDDEYNNRYLTIFTLLTPASLLGVPLVDLVVQRYGFVGGFQTVNALSLAYNLVRVASDNLNVQILGFVFFSFYRCFLFGVSISFVPTVVSANMNGKAVGLLYALTGVTCFLNIPLARVTIIQLDGNFLIPNLVYTVLILPCVVAAWYVVLSVPL